MPIYVPAHSRRSFLASSLAIGASWSGASVIASIAGSGDTAVDDSYFALLSDTHIPASPEVNARDVNMSENLQRVVATICASSVRPAAVMINGDCAYLAGKIEDYRNLAALIDPLSKAGMPIHLTMGNHDDRDPLYAALRDQRPRGTPPVAAKHVSVIESRHANWFLLDTLKVVNQVTGQLGVDQLRWLAMALDERLDKPAIVMAHHNPQFTPPADGQTWNGIQDTAELFDILQQRRQVKALIFGHTHVWKVEQRERLQLINLPPVAYVFSPEQPSGWVEARLRANGLQLTLRTHDKTAKHPQSGQIVDIAWS